MISIICRLAVQGNRVESALREDGISPTGSKRNIHENKYSKIFVSVMI